MKTPLFLFQALLGLCLLSVFPGCRVSEQDASAASAAEPTGWGTDLPAAMAQAAKEGKLVLADFTGSDWCGWCIKLNKEVFSTASFKQYAGSNLIPVEIDFPQTKPQSPALKATNAALQEKYKVEGFPTLLVFDKNGKEVWRQIGYMAGGPAAWIAKLESLKK